MQHANTKKAQIILDILAQIIKDERLKLKKSQRLMCDEYEIQRSLLSRIESGKNEPMLISLWTISEALGIKLSILIKMIEDKLPNGFTLLED
ncbi:MAG: helix-turn-helix domain-containing protein [Muribaculaceae bacterium]|nr:helix-turn-helix domain-containing protein [Muribaculaceae bacterium]